MQDLAHKFKQLEHLIKRSERILLISHKKPDGDTVGSTTAFAHWLAREGKHPVLFCLDALPNTFAYLPDTQRYTSDTSVFDATYDVVISLDSGDLTYAGVEPHMHRLATGFSLVNIDHHITNTQFADINIVETTASSTSEAVYHFFTVNDIQIDSEMATSLLTGICTDTSNFSNPLTSSQSLDAGSALIALGARFNDIIRYFWKNQSLDALTLWGWMLSRLQYEPAYDVAISYVTEDELKGLPLVITEQMVNFLGGVVRVDTVLLLRERNDGMINGSFRSRTRDVSKVAKLFGGGGHKGASGFAIKGRIEKTDKGIKIV